MILASYFTNLQHLESLSVKPVPIYNHILYYRFSPTECLLIFLNLLRQSDQINASLLESILTATY